MYDEAFGLKNYAMESSPLALIEMNPKLNLVQWSDRANRLRRFRALEIHKYYGDIQSFFSLPRFLTDLIFKELGEEIAKVQNIQTDAEEAAKKEIETTRSIVNSAKK